jgi:hypothetical protein
MVNTLTDFRSYKYSQTTDGTNDYYSGINGTNGFSITPFAGLTGLTFSIILTLPAPISSVSSQRRIFEVADSTRTNLLAIDLGAFSGTLTNEYIGASLVTGTTKSGGRLSAVETISAGTHLIMVSVGDAFMVISIDGVELADTANAFGLPATATSTFTANRVGLMASASGSVPTGATWREAMVINEAWPFANHEELYKFYTRDGNVSMANTDRTAWRFLVTPTSRAKIAALWKGNESGTDLLDSVTTATDLTKTNF